MKQYIQYIQNAYLKCVCWGFVSGSCLGFIPNKINLIIIRTNECQQIFKTKISNIYLPIITGTICALSVALFPLTIATYILEDNYVDKICDIFKFFEFKFEKIKDENNLNNISEFNFTIKY